MKPIEFLTHVEQYNTPFGEQMEAITDADIKICSQNAEWEVLSYYLDQKSKRMVLDIQKKKQ